MPQLILYACPMGALADQIATYFQKSQAQWGANAAHGYMPHCTLTGFFEDQARTIPHYYHAVEMALSQHQATQPVPTITLQKISFQPHWHGLEFSSPWLQQLTTTFAALAISPTRPQNLRLKDWLHLSLAYEFPADQHEPLQSLAIDLIDLAAPVSWELRFYEQRPSLSLEERWSCHGTWALSA